MKSGVARQSLFTATVVLLLVAAAGFVRLGWCPSPAETVDGIASPTSEWLQVLRSRWPGMSIGAAVLLLLFTGLTLGRIGIRYNLYAVGSCLGVSLYAILACGIFVGRDYLTGFLAAFLLARVIRNYCGSFRNGYTFDALFRGSLYLGLLPLIYPPALLFVLLLPWGLVCFKRTLREAVVSLSGLLLPAVVVCYLWWGAGENFTDPLCGLWQAFLTPVGMRMFDSGSLAAPVLLGLSLFLILCAVLFFLSEQYASGTRVRTILIFNLGALLLAFLLFFVPSATTAALATAAVPASLLLPFLFVRIRPSFASLAYCSLLILCVLRFFL